MRIVVDRDGQVIQSDLRADDPLRVPGGNALTSKLSDPYRAPMSQLLTELADTPGSTSQWTVPFEVDEDSTVDVHLHLTGLGLGHGGVLIDMELQDDAAGSGQPSESRPAQPEPHRDSPRAATGTDDDRGDGRVADQHDGGDADVGDGEGADVGALARAGDGGDADTGDGGVADEGDGEGDRDEDRSVGDAGDDENESRADSLTSPSAEEAAVGKLRSLVAVVTLLALGLLTRLVSLGSLPIGPHGDEAVTWLVGNEIMQGQFPVYDWRALGQPTLPFAVSGLLNEFFGDSLFVLRIAAALASVAIVLCIYFATRKYYGFRPAVAAGFMYGGAGIALHYGRIAYGLAFWPLVGIVAVWLLAWSMERRQTWGFVVSGAIFSLGVYVYNASWIFGLVGAVGVMVWAVAQFFDPDNDKGVTVRSVLGFGVGGLVTLAPMLRVMFDDKHDYWSHPRLVSLFNTPEWSAADGLLSKLGLVFDGYVEVWDALIFSPEIDYADGMGITQPISRTLVVLALGGIVSVLWAKKSNWFGYLCVLAVFMAPLASAITTGGDYRRVLVMIPMLAVLAGIGFAWCYDRLVRRSHVYAALFVAVVALFVAILPVQQYFTTFRDSPAQKWIFVEELLGPSEAMNAHPDAFVNFYSARHSLHYESLQFLAPNVIGTDRSAEFGGEEAGLDPLSGYDSQRQLFIFVGPYVNQLVELETMWPDGEVVAESSVDVPYVAYLVPASR